MWFLLCMLTHPSFAVDEITFDESQEGDEGEEDCDDDDNVYVDVHYTIDLTEDHLHAFEDLVVRGKARHKRCKAKIEELEVLLDGTVLWDQKFNLKSKREDTEDWHLDTGDVDVDDIGRSVLAGRHTLTARIRGEISDDDTALSIEISGLHRFSRDWDGDGYVSHELDGDDCDDDVDTVHPDVVETWYDGVDQNCDGLSDYDQDGDGHNHRDHGGDDCDDTDVDTFPGADETWYDGVDGDCSGGSDFDQDGDGHDAADHGGDDCDDLAPSVNPDAVETWYDGVDSDCSGGSDYDRDGDGHDSDAYSGDDCDDDNAAVNPGAQEVWYDGLDTDCDGGDDYDQDRDGFGVDVDCDDVDASAFPGSRNHDEDCGFRVQDDGSRDIDTPLEHVGTGCGGCSVGGSEGWGALWLAPLLLLGRRRR